MLGRQILGFDRDDTHMYGSYMARIRKLVSCPNVWSDAETKQNKHHMKNISVHGRLHVNMRFAASAVTCKISKRRTSSERKLSLSATRPPFTVEIALLYVFSLSNSLVFVCFFVYPTYHIGKSKAGACLTQAVAPSPGQSRDSSEKVRTFDERTHRHKPFARERFVSVLWLCQAHDQLRDLVEVWALMGMCSPPVRDWLPPDRNGLFFFFQTFVDFALSLPGNSIWICLHLGPWIFSQKRQIRTTSEN